jgi:vitamin B12 transporter
MFHFNSPLRLAGRLAPLLALGAAWCGRAQTDPVVLAPVVTTATRTPESEMTLGSDVSLVSGDEIAREQLTTMADALAGVPAAPVFATGQAGAAASLFLRGSNSNQTLFLVDGIRLNDANTDYQNFIGGARMFASDQIEVVQGPQSTLYGGEAVGGVVSLTSKPGAGPASESVEAEVGSFSTLAGTASAQGSSGGFAYNLSVGGDHTENDRPNNEFNGATLSLRLDDALSKDLGVGLTLRGFESHYGDPSDEYTDNPYDYEDEANWLGTLFAQGQLSENFTTRLIVGGQDRRYVSVEPDPGQPTDVTIVDNLRGVVDWQLTGRLTETNQLTAGVTADDESTRNTGFGAVDHRQTLIAIFADDEWNVFPDVYLTAGVRRDDYDTFGPDNTGRITLAWLGGGHVLKLRGSYATAFDAPSFLDLYGQDPTFVGNPKLVPETARGEDVGLDFFPPGNVGTVSVTAFRTDYRNLIEDNFSIYPATTVNVDQARSGGVEVALKTTLAGAIQTKIAYTYLTAQDQTDQTPLLRRPRDSLNADLWLDAGRGFSLGLGGAYVGQRADIDALTYATVADPGYTVLRAYARWQVSRHLVLKARVENLLGKDYAPVNGYPQAGIGEFLGAEWHF